MERNLAKQTLVAWRSALAGPDGNESIPRTFRVPLPPPLAPYDEPQS
jgi:hypothetical protein